MMRTVRPGPTAHRAPAGVRRSRENLYLFADGQLIASRWTERGKPNPFYAIGNTVYDVIAVEEIVEADGRTAYHVQVVARRR